MTIEPPPLLGSPSYWRNKAEETRVLASLMRPENRPAMETIAQNFEFIAELQERAGAPCEGGLEARAAGAGSAAPASE